MFNSVTSDMLDNLRCYFSDTRLGSLWGGSGTRRPASSLCNYVGRAGPCWTRGAAAREPFALLRDLSNSVLIRVIVPTQQGSV